MRPVLFIVGGILAAGCQGVPPLDATSPGQLAARITGLPGEIEFHAEGAADDLGDPEPSALRLTDAVEASVRNDPRVQQALARWREARAGSEEARILPNPILSLGVGIGLTSAPKVNVGLTQEILAYFQRPHRVGAADARLRGAAEEVLAAALDAVAEVRERYVTVQAVEAQVPVLEERRSILTKLMDFERMRLERGEGVRTDVTSLDAERATVSLDLADREAERREGRIIIARMVGRPSSEAAWSLDAWAAPAPPTGAERTWIETALARRPEIRALGWELAALGEERALVGKWIWEGASAGAEAEYDDGVFLGPTLEIPLPLRNPSGPRDAAAAAAEAEVRHRITETRRRVIEEIRTAWAADEWARRALSTLQTEVLPLLERRHAEVEAAYRAGEGELAEVLLADQALVEARGRRIELEERAALSRIRLERAAAGAVDVPVPADPGASGHA